MFCVRWKGSRGGLFDLVAYYFMLGIVFAIFSKSCEAQQVDIRGIAETCKANFVTQDYREDWEDIDKLINAEWKVRMASKLHIYLMAHSMYQTTNFKDFDEEHYKKACFHVDRVNGWGVTNTTGFGDHSVVMKMVKTDVPRVYRFLMPFGYSGATGGTASVILSDNDLYTAFEFCFDNGLRTFAVFSRNQINDDRDAIKLHLRSIGFKERHMVNLRPNNCEADPDSKDLPKPGVSIVYVPGPPGGPPGTGPVGPVLPPRGEVNLGVQARPPAFYLPRA